MSLLSRALGFILFWSSFLPLAVQRKIQYWTLRIERILRLEQRRLYRSLADVSLELHAVSKNLYLSVERLAKKRRSTAILWDRRFKFPLLSALQNFGRFSEQLLSRAGGSPPIGEKEVDNDMRKLILAVVSNGVHRSRHKLRDLTSEIELLGDFPAAQGVLSSIWLGRLGNGTQVAVKTFIPARTGTQEEFIREAHVWFRASYHENILPLLGIARVRDSLALISPWMPERDLGTYLTTHPNANRLELLADVARGLAYLHSKGIVYGNLRSSTVVVSGMGRAYLSSFLVAHVQTGDDLAPTNALNWRVISPEFLNGQNSPSEAERRIVSTPESDAFAYGVTSLEVITDHTPYMSHRAGAIRRVLESKLPERPHALDNLGLTDDFWSLVTNCWDRDPMQRPKMSDVAHRMVQLADSFSLASRDALRTTRSRDIPKDISAEIKKLSEYPIASGGNCDLYLGERLGTEKVALKVVRFIGSEKDAARRRLMNEASLWAEFQHPRILEFYGICEYGTMSLYMVSPWLENGNIHQYLSDVNPAADRHELLREAAEGLMYLHSRKPPVLHGDLKGANILITNAGTAVLGDFGLSKFSHEATLTVLQGAGSPRWMAPELILAGDDVTGPLKTQKSDVYAFGHVILEVLSGKKPFYNLKEDLHVIVELIRGGRSPRPDGSVADKWLDDASWAISRQYTALDPEARPGIEIFLNYKQVR